MPRLEGVKVLLVDDTPDTREVMTLFLESQGAVVLSAESLPQALDAVKSFAPSVLVSDLAMPGVDGFELLRQVRARPEATTLPAVAFSGLGSAADREKAKAAGYDQHLVKPVDPDRLVQAILAVTRKG